MRCMIFVDGVLQETCEFGSIPSAGDQMKFQGERLLVMQVVHHVGVAGRRAELHCTKASGCDAGQLAHLVAKNERLHAEVSRLRMMVKGLELSGRLIEAVRRWGGTEAGSSDEEDAEVEMLCALSALPHENTL